MHTAVPAQTTTGDHRAEISLEWLIRLRWGSVLGQAATVCAARALLGPEVPLARLLAFVAVLAASNAALRAVASRTHSHRVLCGAALTLDTLLLTGLLRATGGPNNPFGVLYLVQIALAAVVLRARWTWFLAALSLTCYGLLFASYVPLRHLEHSTPEMSLHLQGMWLAFGVASILTAYFVVKLASALERRDADLLEMRERAARHERLAAVTTLAASAAHELGTPLATIAVAAKELERSIRLLPPREAEGLVGDAALIRSEVDRCRAILDRLAADSGQMPGEAPQEMEAEDLLAAILRALPLADQGRLDASAAGNGSCVRLPRAALVQIAQNLLRNAFDASPGRVELSVETAGSGLTLCVHDGGSAIPPGVLARVGEPFFSTKGPGRGFGLGVFIARSLSEQMGGRLTIESRAGAGTTACVTIGSTPAAGP